MKLVYLLLLFGITPLAVAQQNRVCSDSVSIKWMNRTERRVQPKSFKTNETIKIWNEPYFLILSPLTKEGYLTLYINQIKGENLGKVKKVHTQAIALTSIQVESILQRYSELQISQIPSDCFIEGYNFNWVDCNEVIIEQMMDKSPKLATFSCPSHQTAPEAKRINEFVTFTEELLDKRAKILAFHNSLPKGVYSSGMTIITKI